MKTMRLLPLPSIDHETDALFPLLLTCKSAIAKARTGNAVLKVLVVSGKVVPWLVVVVGRNEIQPLTLIVTLEKDSPYARTLNGNATVVLPESNSPLVVNR